KKGLTKFRHDVQMIFQDQYAWLNPRMKVTENIPEGFDVNGLGKSSEERAKKVDDVLRNVGLNPTHGTR
ncbi:ABC transporter ATP-binding protein, partial [Enterococcus faecium]